MTFKANAHLREHREGDNCLEASVPRSFNVLVKECSPWGWMSKSATPTRSNSPRPLKHPGEHPATKPRKPSSDANYDYHQRIDSRAAGAGQGHQVDSVAIAIASPETIRSWSKGEVKNPETINYAPSSRKRRPVLRTHLRTRQDWECSCGKYKRIKHPVWSATGAVWKSPWPGPPRAHGPHRTGGAGLAHLVLQVHALRWALCST